MKLLPILLLFLAFSNCEPVVYDEARGDKYLVVGISDGDSIRVTDKNNKQERVRLATIDAPGEWTGFRKTGKTEPFRTDSSEICSD